MAATYDLDATYPDGKVITRSPLPGDGQRALGRNDDLVPDLALVEKLIGYDTAPAGGSWRGKAVYVADNADGAGDFASFAELSVVEQPARIAIELV